MWARPPRPRVLLRPGPIETSAGLGAKGTTIDTSRRPRSGERVWGSHISHPLVKEVDLCLLRARGRVGRKLWLMFGTRVFFSLWNGMWLKVNVGRVAQGEAFCPNVVQQYFKYGNNSYDIGMDKCFSQLFFCRSIGITS